MKIPEVNAGQMLKAMPRTQQKLEKSQVPHPSHPVDFQTICSQVSLVYMPIS